jgi:hypothetical protein
MGGKLATIPKPLLGYEKFLHSDDPAGWLTWQSKGKNYLDLSDNCPFCSIPNVDRTTAVHVSEQYESAGVKNMSALRLVIDKLARFFVPERLEQLRKITTSLEELSPEQDQFLAGLRGQVETLLDKFNALKELSFVSLRDEPDVDKALRSLKIELDLLDAVNSEDTQGVVGTMNAQLDHVAEQINEIKKGVGIQKARIAKSIEQNQDEINEFLTSAGYKYSVRIESRGDSYRMILEHHDAPGHLEAAASHLSFGERRLRARSVHTSGPPRQSGPRRPRRSRFELRQDVATRRSRSFASSRNLTRMLQRVMQRSRSSSTSPTTSKTGT